MKLSAKLREEHRNPLLRAKIPITVLGFPLTSSLLAGDPSDLSFSLQTNFLSGPSLKLSYHPSASADASSSSTPFSLSIKSGSGLFGSHLNSPLSISAHFSLLSNSRYPAFSLQFKPQRGDFSFKKTISSQPSTNHPTIPHPNPNLIEPPNTSSNPNITLSPNGALLGPFPSIKENSTHGLNSEPNPSGDSSNGGIQNFRLPSSCWMESCCEKDGLLSGFELRARTALPVLEGVVMNLRWGMNFPEDWGKKLPFLTVEKIGIERIKTEKQAKAENKAGSTELLKAMCFCMGRDLEALRKENNEVRQTLEKLEFAVQVKDGKKGEPLTRSSLGSKKKGEEEKKNGVGGDEMESRLQKPI